GPGSLVVLTGEGVEAGVIDGDERVLHRFAGAADLDFGVDKTRRGGGEFEPDVVIGTIAPAGGFGLIRRGGQGSIRTPAGTCVDQRGNIRSVGKIIIPGLSIDLYAWHRKD